MRRRQARGLALILLASGAAVVLGANGGSTVNSNLKQEYIVGSPDMTPTAIAPEVKAIEAKGDYENPRYMELLMPNFYEQHICRIPIDQWPDPSHWQTRTCRLPSSR